MLYRRLTETKNDYGILIPADADAYNYVKQDKDYYLSTYRYNEEHKKIFDEKGTVSGITDVTTEKLWWDFDSEFEQEVARQNAIVLVQRLLDKNIPKEDVAIFFSGNKGYGVELVTTSSFTPKEAKDICFKLAEELQCFDVKMYNANRIFRVYNTRHEKTKRFKIPLTYNQLKELNTDQIFKLAENPGEYSPEFRWNPVDLPPELYSKKTKKEELISKPEVTALDFDFTKKAKGWTNCKWSLLNGNFKEGEGERHYSVMAILATYKALNYPKEHAYFMAKSACKLSAQRNGGTEFPKEEIWRNAESVYSDTWQGGTFSCRDGKSPWLTKICQELGPHKCKTDEEKVFSELPELSQIFNKFANEIDKNKIATGIPELDKNVTLCTSTLVGLLGCPGSGKTSLSLNILNNCSKNNIPSIFFSMDMGVPLVYLKLIQKHFNERLTSDQVFDIFKNDKVKAEKISKLIEENYNNVKFCFKSGLNVDEVRESIINYQEKSGQKVKLVVVDYLECLGGPFSDSTANTAIIAQKLKDLANETETCILLLLQTQKHAAAPDEPLLSMKNIKGSSVIEQACSVILTIWREGYSPNYANMDKFASIATVKDRFNSLWKYDFKWDGLRGFISELNDVEQDELEKLRDRKKIDKSANHPELNF